MYTEAWKEVPVRELFLTPKEVSALLKLKPQSLARRRMKGQPPAFYKFGSRVRYSKAEIEDYIAAHAYSSNKEVQDAKQG